MFGLLTDDEVDLSKLQSSVMAHEGTGPVINGQFMPYKDSLGNPTIGYGHLIANGVSNAAASQILSDDIQSAIRAAQATDWWTHVQGCEPRARACCELMFILGPSKFGTFHKFEYALLADDYEAAADEIINSALEHQDGKRIDLLAQMIRTGADA